MSTRDDLPPSDDASVAAAKLAAAIEREEIRLDTGIVVNEQGLTPRSARFYQDANTEKRRSA